MLLRHKVRNFKSWKAGHDAHLPKRVEAGLAEKYLLRSSDDPNEVVMLFEAWDTSRAKVFVASAELREKMQEVGVVDKPDVYFFNS